MRIEHIQQFLYRMRPFRGNIVSGALSAIDIALWDIKGKHYGAPVWDLLGGKVRDKVRLHLLLQRRQPRRDPRQREDGAEEGFTALKFDPLQTGYQDQSLARLIEGARDMAAAAREAVGLDVDLIFELHRKLIADVRRSRSRTPSPSSGRCSSRTPSRSTPSCSRVSWPSASPSPLANGERINTIWEVRDLLASGGPQYVRPDLGVAGGITMVKKIAALAESYHSALVTHNFLGPLLTAAAVHVDMASPTS